MAPPRSVALTSLTLVSTRTPLTRRVLTVAQAVRRTRQAQDARDAITAELAELVRQQVENQKLIIRLTEQQGPQLVAAVVAAVNGDIGGKVGLGFSTPGYAGAGVRY